MTRDNFAKLLTEIQRAEREVREAGQAEYAHTLDNCLENFDAGANDLGLKPEQVLMVLAHKHWRGITAWVNGHRSRQIKGSEDVYGSVVGNGRKRGS